MSTPRVGSSSSSTSASCTSSRPSATFCWLPPDSVATVSSGPAARMPSVRIQSRVIARWAARLSHPFVEHDAKPVSVRLSATDIGSARPSPLRSSLRYPTRWPMRRAGESAVVDGSDAIRTAPDATGASPKSARTSSVRPDPIKPAMPRISPRRSVNEARRTPGGAARSRTSSATSPGEAVRAGNN